MDDVTDGQSLLAKREVIDFQFAESTLSPKTPFVVACIPAFNEEDSIASVIFMAGMTVEALCPSMNTGRARVSGFCVSWG